MKRSFVLAIAALLCLCLLAGCGASPAEEANSGDSAEPEVQELTAKELQELFEKTYADKGNGLDTAEQLALELAELKNLSADAALPADYEAQYKEWRSEQVTAMLESLYEQYDSIISELKIGSGPIPGACYAERIDFENDGIPELFILSTEKLPNYDSVRQGSDAGLCFVVEVYGTKEGQLEKLGEEHTEAWTSDSVGICKSGETSFIHVSHYAAGYGDGGHGNCYYSIKDGLFFSADYVTCFTANYIEPDGEGEGEYTYDCTSFDKTISKDEYEAIQSKYSETDSIAGLDYTTPNISSGGILPEIPQDVQRRAAMWNVLNGGGIQYARLADMDGDGVEDLVTVEEITKQNEYTGKPYRVPIFRAYTWDGSALQAKNINQAEDYNAIGGIYREKSTGKIYVNYSGGAGPFGWDYFERVSECIKISEGDYPLSDAPSYETDEDGYYPIDWDAYRAARNRFELVEDLIWKLPLYDTVEAVGKQLIE